MLWILLFVFLLFSPSQGVLNGIDLETECLDGIVAAVTDFTFAGASSDYYVTLCTYNLSLYSMWAAAKIYCTPSEIEAGSIEYDGYCMEYGEVELVQYSEVEPALTDAYIKTLQIVDFNDTIEAKIWDNSFLISESLYEASKRTVVSRRDYDFQRICLNFYGNTARLQ